MSLGTLKSYKLLLLIVLLLASCTYKDIKEYSSKEEKITIVKKKKQLENKVVKKKIIDSEVKKDEVPFATVIEEKEIITQKENNKTIKKRKNNLLLKQSVKLDKKNIDKFKFDLIKKGKQNNNTLLIVGGIQGDEPGGFMAASLISTHYTVNKGSVWIVPNLNLYSIIKKSRAPFGDMNRKFASLSKNDPEYDIVQRIKKYITDSNVKLILNLHDGSGFYRTKYIDKNHQPKKWGQCVVIDQNVLPGVKEYSNTYKISEQVVNHLNKNLLNKEHKYRTKNTHTRFKKTYEESEMAKTLTYYAVTNGKSAFGHETSKSLTVPQRVYYKLLAIEKYMDVMGIKYKRTFNLNIKDIKRVLNDDISIKFDDTDIKMPLKDIRNIQRYFPVNKDGIVKYLPSNPLIKIIKIKNEYIIYYGNKILTKLQADYIEHLNFDTKIKFNIDGIDKEASFGDTIEVKDSFLIKDNYKFRVNVIGYKNKSGIETNVNIHKNQFISRYSIEKNGNIYRIEFYKGKKFAGMILIKYYK